MIHLDRNHHPSPLSTTAQNNKDLILPTNPISWPALDHDFPPDQYPNVQQKQGPTAKGPMTPTDTADPRPDSAVSSPPSPKDGNTASPTRERSSSLSPAPSPQPPQNAPTAASTPLSELSPPPDDDEDDATKQEDASDSSSKDAPAPASAPDSPPSKPDDHDSKQSSSNPMPAASPSSPKVESIATPSAAGTQPTSPTPGDPKVVIMLELNEELLKVCMEFQKRRMALAEPQFQAYSARLQSNLQWSASVVDGRGNMVKELPMMDPPPPLDFYATDRIQELYAELPTIFAKDIARRSSISTPLKRERSDDGIPTDGMNKRRDTGEGKTMMPPPPIPSPTASNASAIAPMTNGTGPAGPLHGPESTPQNPGMLGDAAARERARQAQMRGPQTPQGNRQMSPPSGLPNNNSPGGMNTGPLTNAVAGPSGSGGFNPASLPPSVQQLYQLMQNPGHPLMQYVMRHVPGFQQMPVQMQLSKMMQVQAAMRERQMQQANNAGGGGGFPGQSSPVSPIAPGPSPQNSMFPMNAGMDLRSMTSTPLPGGGGGPMMNGGQQMTPQQRQLFLMQQQQRGGAGGGGGGMNPGMVGMNPQQMAAFQQQQAQQERMRMEAQQRMGSGGPGMPGGSPPHPGSPMMGNEFPALRSNAGIPGIARIARSPSDGGGGGGGGGGPGGMGTPRMGPARMPSNEDFQRMNLMQGQPQRGNNPGFGGGGMQGFPGPQPQQGWGPQNPMQQPGMGMGPGGGGGQYGMGGPGPGQRPGSAYGGAPSPPGSGGNQNWGGGGGGGQGGYPFGGPPGSDPLGMQRHMSGTPGPGGMGGQQNPNPMDEFDPFNWG
ncbi:hypothetical protein R3P38DRAFT_653552 [Favolaschia claudopus]|uniref:Uncharacterized protein n=1 Tax=Favolaschia claudopus TaxID=2862362 RepID=A0AAW0ECQ6_9AGAR